MKKYIFSEEYEGRGHKRQRDWFYLASDVDARIAELEKVEESMRQVIDYCTYVQANSTIAREVLKIVKDCGL